MDLGNVKEEGGAEIKGHETIRIRRIVVSVEFVIVDLVLVYCVIAYNREICLLNTVFIHEIVLVYDGHGEKIWDLACD